MSRNYIGAKRKRTNTPAQNRKRAVEYRHRPYATLKIEREPVSEPELILNEAEEAEEPEVIQETAKEPEQPEAASESEETAAEEPAEPALTQAAQTFAAAGFFAKLGSSIKNLFSRKKNAEDESHTVVSDLKTWISSPIDPESESETAESENADAAPEEIVAAQESELTEAADEPMAEVDSEEGSEGNIAEAEEPVCEPAAESEAQETAEAGEVLEEPVILPQEEASESETEPSEEGEPEELSEIPEPSEETEETEQPAEEEAEPAELSEEPVIFPEEEPQEEKPESCEETEPAEEPAGPETPGEEAEEIILKEEAAPSEEPEPVEETAEEPQEISEEPQETAEPEEQAEKEPEEAPLSRKEKRELNKEIRKETKIQLIDEIIDSPRANLLVMLLAPGVAMKRVSTVEKTTLSAPSVFILNFMKWAAVGTFFALFIEKFINHFNYSFIRMNFTGTATMAFRFGVFGLIAEYLCWMIIGLVCGLMRKKISTLKLMEVEARSALFVTLLFVIACLLVWKDMFGYGVALGICGMVIGLMTKGYGMDLVLPISKNTQLILVLILVLASTLGAYKYFPLTVSGLMDIFKAILNL